MLRDDKSSRTTDGATLAQQRSEAFASPRSIFSRCSVVTMPRSPSALRASRPSSKAPSTSFSAMAALYSPSFWSVKNAQTSPTDHSRTRLGVAVVSVFAAADPAADEFADSSAMALGLAEDFSLCLLFPAAAASCNICTSQRGMGKTASLASLPLSA